MTTSFAYLTAFRSKLRKETDDTGNRTKVKHDYHSDIITDDSRVGVILCSSLLFRSEDFSWKWVARSCNFEISDPVHFRSSLEHRITTVSDKCVSYNTQS